MVPKQKTMCYEKSAPKVVYMCWKYPTQGILIERLTNQDALNLDRSSTLDLGLKYVIWVE